MPFLLAALLAVSGGVATFFSFPDFDVWPLAIVGIALLVCSLTGARPRRGLVLGLAFGLSLNLPLLWWAYVSVGIVPWLALSITTALFAAVAAAVWAALVRAPFFARHDLVSAAVFALVWLASEELISRWPFEGFPWGRLAFSQSGSALGRLAWLGGVPLVTLTAALAGALLAVALRRLRPRTMLTGWAALATALVLVGAGFVVPLDARPQAGEMAVGAVQGNVPEPGLHAFDEQRQVTFNHLQGTEELAARIGQGTADLVVWPENASDIDPHTDATTADVIDQAARAVGAPLLVGSIRYTPEGRWNTSMLWIAGQGVVAQYDKQHPAPFAEYIPMRSFARVFSDKVDLVRTDMVAGDKVGVIDVPVARLGRSVPVGDVICFEVTYGDLILDAVKAGAELLVVQTNNASFGYSDEGAQQFAMSRLRAIEHGRATLQISTVGISGIIAPDGRVLQRGELFTAEQFFATLPLRTSLTPAAYVTDPLAYGALVLGALALVMALTKRWWAPVKER